MIHDNAELDLSYTLTLIHEGIKKIKYLYHFFQRGCVHVNLQLLYQCHFRCQICDFWRDPNKRDSSPMPLDKVKQLPELLSPLGPQIISLGGGEPLLHPNIVAITHILSKDHFPVMICNGWHVTPELARDLFRAGMYEVSISLDYASPEKHDQQRGMKGAYAQAIKALKILHENRTRPYQRVHMISVVMDDNLEDIEPLILLSKEIGISYLVTLYSDGRGTRHSRISRTDISSHLLKLRKKYRHFVAIPGYLEKFSEVARNQNSTFPCRAGINLINIDASGKVSRCIDHLDQSAGNIFEDSLGDIMSRLKTTPTPEQCKGCWTSCRGNVETLMYGKNRLMDFIRTYRFTRSIPLGKSF